MKKLGLMLLVACGGGSGGGIGGTGPITQAQADEVCTDVCTKEVECGEATDVATCLPGCTDDFVGWARADAVQQLANCFVAAPCGTSDDATCLGNIQPLPIHEEWEALCRSELAACFEPGEADQACEVSPDPTNDDIGIFRFIAPAIMEEIIACVDQVGCDAQFACIEAVFDAHGINF